MDRKRLRIGQQGYQNPAREQAPEGGKGLTRSRGAGKAGCPHQMNLRYLRYLLVRQESSVVLVN